MNGACTNCYPGYMVQGNDCIVGTTLDVNCKTFQGSRCTVCFTGFFAAADGKCKQVSPLCKTYDINSGACTSCYKGNEVSNGNCVVAVTQDPHCKRSD